MHVILTGIWTCTSTVPPRMPGESNGHDSTPNISGASSIGVTTPACNLDIKFPKRENSVHCEVCCGVNIGTVYIELIIDDICAVNELQLNIVLRAARASHPHIRQLNCVGIPAPLEVDQLC